MQHLKGVHPSFYTQSFKIIKLFLIKYIHMIFNFSYLQTMMMILNFIHNKLLKITLMSASLNEKNQISTKCKINNFIFLDI